MKRILILILLVLKPQSIVPDPDFRGSAEDTPAEEQP